MEEIRQKKSPEISVERGRICFGDDDGAEYTFGEEDGAAVRSADSEDFLFPGPSEAAFKKAKIRKVLAIITTYNVMYDIHHKHC